MLAGRRDSCRVELSRGADSFYIVERFAEWRDLSTVRVDGTLARVVRGQRQLFIVIVPVEQLPEVGHSATDVLRGIVEIVHGQLARGIRDQLHEAHGAVGRPWPRDESRFHLDHGTQEIRRKALPTGTLPDRRLEPAAPCSGRRRPRGPERLRPRHGEALGAGIEPTIGKQQLAVGIAPDVDLRGRRGWPEQGAARCDSGVCDSTFQQIVDFGQSIVLPGSARFVPTHRPMGWASVEGGEASDKSCAPLRSSGLELAVARGRV